MQSRAQAVMARHLDGLRVSGVVLEGGTLTSSAGIVCRALVRPLRGCGTRVVTGDRFVGTLLGPERAGRPIRGVSAILCQDRSASHTAVSPEGEHTGWWGRVAGVWLDVENCTVDASIF